MGPPQISLRSNQIGRKTVRVLVGQAEGKACFAVLVVARPVELGK
jgi:hypothetical protein